MGTSTSERVYRSVDVTGEKFDKKKAVRGYQDAADYVGVSRGTFMAHALAGNIAPVADLPLEDEDGNPRQGRPQKAFRRSDLLALKRAIAKGEVSTQG